MACSSKAIGADLSTFVVSKNEPMWRFGMIRPCPGETGNASRIQTARSFSPLIRARNSSQKAQAWLDIQAQSINGISH